MAIPLTGAGGLFTRLGRLGNILYNVNQSQDALVSSLESTFVQYDELSPPGLRNVVNNLIALRPLIIANQGNWIDVIQPIARDTVLGMMQADNPSQASTLARAIAELVRQMNVSGNSVKIGSVNITPTAGTGNLGNGTIAVSFKRSADGTNNQLLIDETARLTVVNSASASFTGAVGNLGDPFAYNWPTGSGIITPLPIRTQASTNILLNGDFETFTTTDTPDNWTIEAGVASTNFFKETGTVYTGSACLKIPGNATAGRISQKVDSSFAPLTSYALALWIRTSGVPAAGVLVTDYTNAAGTVLADAGGNSNTKSTALTALAANTWTPITFVIRTGRIVPSGAKLRIRLSTALSVGTNLFIDRAILYQMNAPYNGGPLISLFHGSTDFPAGDYFDLDVQNDRGGSSYCATFQALFDRFFNMRSLGLQLPCDGSPTIADTLITS